MKITKWMILAAANGQLGTFFVRSNHTIVLYIIERRFYVSNVWNSRVKNIEKTYQAVH